LKSGEKDLIFEEDVHMDEVLEAAQKVTVGRAWGGSLRSSSRITLQRNGKWQETRCLL